ncbi:hypothetical protein MVEN_00067700 [Mycena venus]|uniref:Uncharacterized protein n=1 Tax=Mycena venus TaxID=2733690 RepID=A0A8H6Z3U8_9AGAR|nr:hypothetical protein MVEN_00067700 [Mycena venus]
MQGEVNASDLGQAGHMLIDNMHFIALALGILFEAVDSTGPDDDAAIMTLIRGVAVELESLAAGARLIVHAVQNLQLKSRPPYNVQDLAEDTLSEIDRVLGAAQRSCDTVHSIAGGGALPSVVYSTSNPIPALCDYIGWSPPRVCLWRELRRFPDVLNAMDGVLSAAQKLRRLVKEALDAPERFLEKRALATDFSRQYTLSIGRAGIEMEVKAENLHAGPWPYQLRREWRDS